MDIHLCCHSNPTAIPRQMAENAWAVPTCSREDGTRACRGRSSSIWRTSKRIKSHLHFRSHSIAVPVPHRQRCSFFSIFLSGNNFLSIIFLSQCLNKASWNSKHLGDVVSHLVAVYDIHVLIAIFLVLGVLTVDVHWLTLPWTSTLCWILIFLW